MFYFGHGSDVSLGPAPGAHVGVYTDEIQAFLINGVTTGTTNFFTPFSFVFLYGCDTAKSDWPLAFGIEKRKVATSEYTARGIPPRAFVGWTSEKRAGIGWHFIKAHSDFVIIMFERWSSGLLLKPAIDYAISQTQSFQAPDIFGDENLKWDWTQ